MKHSEPPKVATRLLEVLASGPHDDALAGDLIEQFREGRSAVWYWRQVLLAIAVCLAKDRALRGPAIVGSLLAILLVLLSVLRHPASLGTGLLITDIAMLSGYGAFSVWVWRQRSTSARYAFTAGAQSGMVLGLVLIASHATEWLGLFENKPAALIRGVGSVMLMLGLLSAAGSAAWQRTRSRVLAVLAGLWCGAISVLMLLNFALTLNLVFEKHATVWLYGAFSASGMSDPGAYVVRNALESASEVLIRMPIAALVVSIGASLSSAWIRRWPRSLAVFAASFTPLMFLAGVACIWHADALARAARPPFIMAGLMMAGVALCGAHPLWSLLYREKALP